MHTQIEENEKGRQDSTWSNPKEDEEKDDDSSYKSKTNTSPDKEHQSNQSFSCPNSIIASENLSPNTIAEAAYEAGLRRLKKRDATLVFNTEQDVQEDSSKRLCIQDEFTEEKHNEDISEERSNIQVDEMQRAVFAQVDNLIQAGLQLYAERDELVTELTHVKEVSNGRLKEIQRLKESEETLRVSMSVGLCRHVFNNCLFSLANWVLFKCRIC